MPSGHGTLIGICDLGFGASDLFVFFFQKMGIKKSEEDERNETGDDENDEAEGKAYSLRDQGGYPADGHSSQSTHHG